MKLYFTCICIYLSAFASGQVTFVNSIATGNNSGADWENAYTDLYQAMANTSSGEIWVAEGIYTPTASTDRNVFFRLEPNVDLYGGFSDAGDSEWENRDGDLHPTILSGDLGIISDTSDNSYKILSISVCQIESENTIDGFTFSHGNSDYGGGGIRMSGSRNFKNDILIENCTFNDNFADYEGAAVSASRVALRVKNCIFFDNYSGYEGAGIDVYQTTLQVQDSKFFDNYADYEGAAISTGSSELFVENSLFEDNYADYEAGAISHFPGHFQTDDYKFQCVNSVFRNNESRVGGGATDSGGTVNFYNCLFDGNKTGRDGGAFCLFGWGTITSTNCTFVNNEAGMNGSILSAFSFEDTNTVNAFFRNSVFKDNIGQGMIDRNENVDEIAFSNSFFPACPNNAICEDGNITGTDPLFVDEGNYRPMNSSPCIDSGDSDIIPTEITTDLAGNDRIRGASVDMGAYESDKVSGVNGLLREKIRIYPNPTNADLTIFTDSNFLEGKLYDAVGREIRYWKLSPANSNTVDVNNIKPGAYFLQLWSGKRRVIKKVSIY